jgi:hypothetical protein
VDLDPDPGGPQTCRSGSGFGSATLPGDIVFFLLLAILGKHVLGFRLHRLNLLSIRGRWPPKKDLKGLSHEIDLAFDDDMYG